MGNALVLQGVEVLVVPELSRQLLESKDSGKKNILIRPDSPAIGPQASVCQAEVSLHASCWHLCIRLEPSQSRGRARSNARVAASLSRSIK